MPQLLGTLALGVLMSASLLLTPQSAGQPRTVTPENGPSLPRAGEATRHELLGAVDLYSVAIYADAPLTDAARLRSPDRSKAVRLVVLSDDHDLGIRVRTDWWRELVPRLQPDAMAQLQSTFSTLRHGDVLLVEYVPGRGTRLRVNQIVAASRASHDLMLAFLDHWLGQRPVSEDMKAALISGQPMQ
ncbi:MAG TPA: chalcone isomerase family protein [Gemmatimonadales bacterium]|nr:chalcone isomerase family protein [Gemmatimonadales bacterium]